MSQGSQIIRGSIAAAAIVVVMLVGVVAGTSTAIAGQAVAKSAEPKRSYGSIDVIMYQTSW